MASSVLKELDDLNKLEKEVNEALQKAEQGKLIPTPISLSSLPLPSTPLTENATSFAKSSLDPAVFLHSMRAYFLGTAVATQHFSHFCWDPHVTYVAAMLHDVGISSQAFRQTSLSFEFYGGVVAREFLLREGASASMSDTVAEAIIRHTDDIYADESFGHSPECILLILGTHLDVYGAFAPLIHADTVEETVKLYPRSNFNNVFADLLVEEVKVKKGFCRTSKRMKGEFMSKVRINEVFAKYDG